MNQKRTPETQPHKYTQLIFEKGIKPVQGRKNSLSTNAAWTIEYAWEKDEQNQNQTKGPLT